MKISRSDIATVIEAVMLSDVKKATKYIAPDFVISATRRKYSSTRHTEVLLTMGRPNFAQRKFIKVALKAKEPFPIKKIQIKVGR
jgi:hypothetical protein